MSPGALTLAALALLLIAGGLVHWTVALVTGDAEGDDGWRKRMTTWLATAQQQPSGSPAEVLDRLLTHAREREERMAGYRRAWERRWREAAAGAAPQVRRQLWSVK